MFFPPSVAMARQQNSWPWMIWRQRFWFSSTVTQVSPKVFWNHVEVRFQLEIPTLLHKATWQFSFNKMLEEKQVVDVPFHRPIMAVLAPFLAVKKYHVTYDYYFHRILYYFHVESCYCCYLPPCTHPLHKSPPKTIGRILKKSQDENFMDPKRQDCQRSPLEIGIRQLGISGCHWKCLNWWRGFADFGSHVEWEDVFFWKAWNLFQTKSRKQ